MENSVMQFHRDFYILFSERRVWKHLLSLDQSCEFANVFFCDSKDIQEITRNWIWNNSPSLGLHLFLLMSNWVVSEVILSARLEYPTVSLKTFYLLSTNWCQRLKSSWLWFHVGLIDTSSHWVQKQIDEQFVLILLGKR